MALCQNQDFGLEHCQSSSEEGLTNSATPVLQERHVKSPKDSYRKWPGHPMTHFEQVINILFMFLRLKVLVIGGKYSLSLPPSNKNEKKY